jgi:PIN domain nuclease of toxin-antitoxin system
VDLLLDTHAFLWWTAVDPRLIEAARAAIADPANRVIVSAVSVWEISIKRTSGKLAFRDDILQVLASTGFETLDITPAHADMAGALPMHHADPFDRLLIAQARIEGLVLVTQDRHLLPYGVPVLGIT